MGKETEKELPHASQCLFCCGGIDFEIITLWVIISPLLTTKHHQLNVNEKLGRKKINHRLKHKSMIKKEKESTRCCRVTTPYQNSQSVHKNLLHPPPPSLQVGISTQLSWTPHHTENKAHTPIYVLWKTGEKKQKTSMHLVTISVCLCMSEFTGNTLALCPMQTQLFLKSSCPFISYFNRYRPCQIRER